MLEFLSGVLLVVVIVTIIGHWWKSVWGRLLKWSAIATAGMVVVGAIGVAAFVAKNRIWPEADNIVRAADRTPIGRLCASETERNCWRPIDYDPFAETGSPSQPK